MNNLVKMAVAGALLFSAPSAGAQEVDAGDEPSEAKPSGSAKLSLGGEAEASTPSPSTKGEPANDDAPVAETAGDEVPDETAAPPPIPDYAGARAKRDRVSRAERYARLPYLQRYKPQANLWEVGLFLGALFPSPEHNLKVAVLPVEEYSTAAVQVGARLAYFPLAWIGAEVEGFGGGGSTKDEGYSSVFYGLRGHALLQLPFWSVTPFALVGGGVLAATTERMGHDRDPAFHFGGGVKVPVSHRVTTRLDVRDTLTQKRDAANGKQTHHPEVHLGVSFVFDRKVPDLPPDVDYDGLYDFEDKCPTEGALTIDGCPTDSDGDGLDDHEDQCPTEPGGVPTGCPNRDVDGDGVPTPADQCPDEAGPAPTGCPDRDEDGDGLVGADDKCPKAAEVRNGFEDDDGCPDEMPEAVQRFTGIIQGINFKQGTAEIEEASLETLDSAAEILREYPSIKLEVSGHTSSEGSADRNDELSLERAESVKKYFLDKGIGDDRIVTRGAGSSEPIADNATKEGRRQNRRIEFRVLAQP